MKKTAIVTGAGRGIGFSIAKKMGEEGYRVVLIARSAEEKYGENLNELREKNIEFMYIQADVSEPEGRKKSLEMIVEKYGRVDILVNNAGIAPSVRKDLLEMSEESFDTVLKVNTKSVMFFSQIVAKQMIKQEIVDGLRGIIVNISSMSAEVSSISRGEYCVSKAGVSMLTRLYADRLSEEQIYVYEIRPGIIETDMTGAVHDKYSKLFKEGLCPISRWGKPEDVAEAVSIFCSGKLKYTTGQAINVDGGFQMKRL